MSHFSTSLSSVSDFSDLLHTDKPKREIKTEFNCINLCVCTLSCYVQLFGTLQTVARQAPQSMGFSRQEYWSGYPFPSPVHLPNPGTECTSPALVAEFFITEPPGKASIVFLDKWLSYKSLSLGLFLGKPTWDRRSRKAQLKPKPIISKISALLGGPLPTLFLTQVLGSSDDADSTTVSQGGLTSESHLCGVMRGLGWACDPRPGQWESNQGFS